MNTENNKTTEILIIDKDYIRETIANSKTKEFKVIINKFDIIKLENVINLNIEEDVTKNTGELTITQSENSKPIQPIESFIFIKNDDYTYDIYGFDYGATLVSIQLTVDGKLISKLSLFNNESIKGYKVSFEFLNPITYL